MESSSDIEYTSDVESSSEVECSPGMEFTSNMEFLTSAKKWNEVNPDLLECCWSGTGIPSYRRWGSMEDGAIEIGSLTMETLEGALEVFRKSYCVHENVCKALSVMSEPNAVKELEELCIEAAMDGISLVAIDAKSREVIGVCFNRLQYPVEPDIEKPAFEEFSDKCKYKQSKSFADFMTNVDNKVDMFRHYNTKCTFECMFLATLPEVQKRGIGESLVSSSIKIAKELQRRTPVKIRVIKEGYETIPNPIIAWNRLEDEPNVICAIMTSNYSQKIATKCGFETLAKVNYKDFHVEGIPFSDMIGDEHHDAILVAKRL